MNKNKAFQLRLCQRDFCKLIFSFPEHPIRVVEQGNYRVIVVTDGSGI